MNAQQIKRLRSIAQGLGPYLAEIEKVSAETQNSDEIAAGIALLEFIADMKRKAAIVSQVESETIAELKESAGIAPHDLRWAQSMVDLFEVTFKINLEEKLKRG